MPFYCPQLPINKPLECAFRKTQQCSEAQCRDSAWLMRLEITLVHPASDPASDITLSQHILTAHHIIRSSCHLAILGVATSAEVAGLLELLHMLSKMSTKCCCCTHFSFCRVADRPEGSVGILFR